jgi:heme exporter protein B
MTKRILAIIEKEFQVDYRQKHAIAGILLFAVICVYLIYKSFNNFTGLEWTLMLWIITVFAGINSIVKSFLQEYKGTYIYYYTLFDPTELLIAKLIYNTFLLAFIFCVILGLMILLTGNPVKDWGLFWSSSLLAIVGLSTVFTLISAMSNVGGNNSTLMSILAMPCILPILLTVIQITAVSLRLIQKSNVDMDLLILGGIDGMLLGISLFLFPQVWKA